jgi:ATP-dependent Zn protease
MKKKEKEKKKRETAYHESAHAVVLYRTAGHPGCHVTIAPRQQQAG